jgi:hypothetical protein
MDRKQRLMRRWTSSLLFSFTSALSLFGTFVLVKLVTVWVSLDSLSTQGDGFAAYDQQRREAISLCDFAAVSFFLAIFTHALCVVCIRNFRRPFSFIVFFYLVGAFVFSIYAVSNLK